MARIKINAFALAALVQGLSVALAMAQDSSSDSSNTTVETQSTTGTTDDTAGRSSGSVSGGTTDGNTQVSRTDIKTEEKKERTNRGFQIGVVGNYTAANPSEIRGGSATTAGSADDPIGAGVLFQAPLGKSASIGPEVHYLTRSGGVARDNFQMLHVPVIARVYPFRILSLGFGGYYSRVLSDRNASRVASPALQFSDNDYGAVGVAGFDIPVSSGVGIIAEGRLTQSIASKVGDADTWNDRNLQGVAGIRLNLSEL